MTMTSAAQTALLSFRPGLIGVTSILPYNFDSSAPVRPATDRRGGV
jgi:hypothetical protein